MRKSRCKRNQTQQGGGLGGVVEFRADSLGPIVNNDLAWKMGSSCLEAPRPGSLSDVPARGLPGMSGGRRRKQKKQKRSRKLKVQSGGRYGFDPSQTVGLGTPWGSSYAPVASIPCEASRSAIPDSGAANTLNTPNSYLWSGPKPQVGGGAYNDTLTPSPIDWTGTPTTQKGELNSMKGGALVVSPAPVTWSATHSTEGSAGNIGMEVSKAGYTQNPGTANFDTAAGTKVMINLPDSRIYESAACFKTGGGRKRRTLKKKSRKAKKTRKH